MAKMIVKKFTSSGSWTAPAGVTRVCVRLWGGGAGGENPDFTSPASGFGGLAGGCAPERVFYLEVVPNTSYTITIGAGGTAGTSGAGGGDGGNTTFGSLATGKGCSGGTAFPFIGFTNLIDDPIVPYGVAANGTDGSSPAFGGQGGFNGPGGSGGAGGNASDAGTATAGSAAAANSGGGGGGGGGTNSGTGGNGGAGGSGYLEVMWVE